VLTNSKEKKIILADEEREWVTKWASIPDSFFSTKYDKRELIQSDKEHSKKSLQLMAKLLCMVEITVNNKFIKSM
jgi:hypothetical protein